MSLTPSEFKTITAALLGEAGVTSTTSREAELTQKYLPLVHGTFNALAQT